MPKTKIICTLGPASSTETVLRGMARAGMSIARLNFSHGTHAEHLDRINKVRAMNKKNGCCVQILLDLEGPRIRTGHLKDHKPVLLKKNQLLTLTTKPGLGDERVQHVDFRGSFSFLKKGMHVFIDDGNIGLQVVKTGTHTVVTRVLTPYLLKEQKGINIPEAELPFRGLSDKDKDDIAFGIRHKVDFIAQSFVRTKEDVLNVRKFIGGKLPACRIVSKIENRKGIRNLESILKVSDGLMIARGDLGISLPIYEVPLIQKQIIRMCNFSDRFAITATQMLESMTTNRKPTRAEVSDVANAILDRTDYVMLSGETAVGNYPVETVRMMRQIIDFTEKPPAFIFAE